MIDEREFVVTDENGAWWDATIVEEDGSRQEKCSCCEEMLTYKGWTIFFDYFGVHSRRYPRFLMVGPFETLGLAIRHIKSLKGPDEL